VPEYGPLPPWLSTDNGSSYGAEIMRGRELKQRQKEQNFYQSQQPSMAQQAEVWKQKQVLYQKQADVLAQRALQDQEFQKSMTDINTQVQSGKMTQDQARFLTALAYMTRGQTGASGASSAMNAMKPAPNMTPQAVSIPGQPPPTPPSAGYTGQLNTILQAAGKPGGIAPQPGTPPQTLGYNIAGEFQSNRALGIQPPAAPPPTSVRELPVLRDDGTPDPTQFAIAGPKGVIVRSRKAKNAASPPKVTDINKYHRAKQDSTTLTAILNSPEKLTKWAGLHADGDEAEAKEIIQDKLDAAQEDVEALQEQYKDYDFSKEPTATPADQTAPTATNPKTGQKLHFKDGQWQPIQP
jgi:hypothetical protein